MSGGSGGRPAAGAARPYHFPTATRAVLGNGLTVLAVPLRRLPIASALLVSDAGAECDPVTGAGVAALMAAALAEGTAVRDGVALVDAFERLGGALHVDATWTHVECGTTVQVARLPEALALLAEVLRRPAFAASEVTRLREERLAELLQQEAEPRGLADDLFARCCAALASRYALPAGGDRTTVAAITPEALAAHHARHVAPARTWLVVVGDVAPAQVLALAEATLGDWAGAGAEPPPLVVAPAHAARGVHLVARADAPQTELRVGHLSVPRTHADFHALSVMNAILGGLFNSRINLNLREEHGYTYGASSHFDWRRAASLFEVATAVQREVTAEALREILGEVERIRREPVSPAELTLAVDYLTGVFPIRFETTAAIADALAMRELFGLPGDYFDAYRERIAAVRGEDVLRVAQAHLDPARLQVVAVGDADAVEAGLAASGAGAVHGYDADGTPTG